MISESIWFLTQPREIILTLIFFLFFELIKRANRD
jgi:hypothetical protein